MEFIPFHRPHIDKKDIEAVSKVLEAGWLTMGKKVIEFEQAFKNYVKSSNAVSVNSCTAAMHLALEAMGIGEGDLVVVPDLTFTATAEVTFYLKARPIIIDVDPNTGLIDLNMLEDTVKKYKIKACIPVHYGGLLCNMDAIMDLSEKYGFKVIEDAAHCLPSQITYRGQKRPVGSIGHVTCFSFYATKTIAIGEGGMATTEDDKIANRMRIMRLHGIDKDSWKRYTKEGSWFYQVVSPGYKYNMTDPQAALGLTQLKKCDWMGDRRRYIAQRYIEGLSDTEGISILHKKWLNSSEILHSWHLFVILIDPTINGGRNRFIEDLKNQNIGTSVHFIPLHRHPFYRKELKLDSNNFPGAEYLFERIVSLPIYPSLEDSHIEYIIKTIKDLLQ